MGFFYNLNQIDKGSSSMQSRLVYKKAKYRREHCAAQKIVFKLNKNSNCEFSRLEAAFSAVARLFLSPNLTPQQFLVKNEDQEIVGLASEHFCYAVGRREAKAQTFAKIPKNSPYRLKRTRVKTTEKIPIYFFNEFDENFIEFLWDKKKKGEIEFDYSSLASVLSSSYTLEEDDFHKGNFGFYLVKSRSRYKLVFFKVDNDLMMSDELMSRYQSRLKQCYFDEKAFAITQADLIAFPKLLHSKNYYWPTHWHYSTNFYNKKSYSQQENRFFEKIGEKKKFIRAKWREFYKHILIPEEVIKQSLEQIFDPKIAEERAMITVIMQALIARQSRLRAVLFSIEEFRDFVKSFKGQSKLQEEILWEAERTEYLKLNKELKAKMQRYQELCASKTSFIEGDNPLHILIRLEDYRYQESLEAFRDFINQPNKVGETVLDLVIAKAIRETTESTSNPQTDLYSIASSLTDAGAKPLKNTEVKLGPSEKDYKPNYLKKAGQATTGKEFIKILRDLSENHSYSLKMQKEFAILALKKFIKRQNQHEGFERALIKIKATLNNKNSPGFAKLKFIRQLRSRLWIVRYFRGLWGKTATLSKMNEIIDRELTALNKKTSFYAHFFKTKNPSLPPIDSPKNAKFTPDL